jgi:hypothetical protein
MYDKLVALMNNMLELQKKHHETRMERDKELYERQMKIVDAQIDKANKFCCDSFLYALCVK